jgi:hypothetical protein
LLAIDAINRGSETSPTGDFGYKNGWKGHGDFSSKPLLEIDHRTCITLLDLFAMQMSVIGY